LVKENEYDLVSPLFTSPRSLKDSSNFKCPLPGIKANRKRAGSIASIDL
jgi:hypothetical protein